MPLELRTATPPAKSGLERGAHGFCNHRRGLTRPVGNGSDHSGRTEGVEQTQEADKPPNNHCRTVRHLAMGAAFEVFLPDALAGQEVNDVQEARNSSDFADVILLGEAGWP